VLGFLLSKPVYLQLFTANYEYRMWSILKTRGFGKSKR
jgi:hypothetical protein